MGLNDFIISDNKIYNKIEKWFIEPYSKQIIIDGLQGNGKTFLIELFAEKYGYHLQRIDPYDFTNIKEFNNILKTLNLLPIDCNQTKKIVLIENINEFHKNYRTRLFEIQNFCNYPIVITGYKIDIPFKYRNKIEVFRINKPTPTKIKMFLERKLQKLNIQMDDNVLEQIAKLSPSVRSAINSLYNSSPNEITNPIPSYFEQLNNIKYKQLKGSINRNMLYYLFGNIKDFETMNMFCMFDMQLAKMFKVDIDSYLFNTLDFNFVDNSYPDFMNKQYNNKEDIVKYIKYVKDLHVSTRTLRTEFLDLLKMLEDEKPQKTIKKINNYLNKQNILDFV